MLVLRLRCLWKAVTLRRNRVVEADRTRKDMNDAPDADHDDESDDAVDHDIATAFTLLFVRCSCDEVAENAEDKDNKRERKHQRNRDVVDEVDDPLCERLGAIDGLARRLRKGDRWEEEREAAKSELFHTMRVG